MRVPIRKNLMRPASRARRRFMRATLRRPFWPAHTFAHTLIEKNYSCFIPVMQCSISLRSENTYAVTARGPQLSTESPRTPASYNLMRMTHSMHFLSQLLCLPEHLVEKTGTHFQAARL